MAALYYFMNRVTGKINSVSFPEDNYRYPDLDIRKKEEVADIMKWVCSENGWSASDGIEAYSCFGHKSVVFENDNVEYIDVDAMFD